MIINTSICAEEFSGR